VLRFSGLETTLRRRTIDDVERPRLCRDVARACVARRLRRPRRAARRTIGDSKDRITASDESDASKRATVRMELAAAYFGRGQMTTALDQVKLAIQADPTSSEAYNLRGLIYANLGDDKLAEESSGARCS
jgi:type IV pilus assembly protein PilF